jgi:hypothetical protein
MENVAFNVGNEAFFDEVMMALVGGEVAAPLVEVHLRGRNGRDLLRSSSALWTQFGPPRVDARLSPPCYGLIKGNLGFPAISAHRSAIKC